MALGSGNTTLVTNITSIGIAANGIESTTSVAGGALIIVSAGVASSGVGAFESVSADFSEGGTLINVEATSSGSSCCALVSTVA